MRPNLIALVPLALVGAAAGPGADTSARNACGDRYVVVRHDTLYSIARRCRSSVARVAAANRIANPARIEVGQILNLGGGDSSGAKPDDAQPARSRARDAGFAYAMARQDTLYSLARWSRVGVPALLAANPGVDPHKVEIGDLIRLPRGAVDPQPMRTRERGPATAAAAPLPPPAATSAPPRAHAAPPRPSPPPRAAPPRPAPPAPRHVERDDDAGKPDDGNLNGRNQPEGM